MHCTQPRNPIFTFYVVACLDVSLQAQELVAMLRIEGALGATHPAANVLSAILDNTIGYKVATFRNFTTAHVLKACLTQRRRA